MTEQELEITRRLRQSYADMERMGVRSDHTTVTFIWNLPFEHKGTPLRVVVHRADSDNAFDPVSYHVNVRTRSADAALDNLDVVRPALLGASEPIAADIETDHEAAIDLGRRYASPLPVNELCHRVGGVDWYPLSQRVPLRLPAGTVSRLTVTRGEVVKARITTLGPGVLNRETEHELLMSYGDERYENVLMGFVDGEPCHIDEPRFGRFSFRRSGERLIYREYVTSITPLEVSDAERARTLTVRRLLHPTFEEEFPTACCFDCAYDRGRGDVPCCEYSRSCADCKERDRARSEELQREHEAWKREESERWVRYGR